MGDNFNFIGDLGNIMKGFNGLSQISAAQDMAIAGGQQEAAGLRVAGASSMAAATYNSQVVAANLVQSMDALGREIRTTTSMQRTQAAFTGLNAGSASFLSVMNSTMDTYQMEHLKAVNAAQQQEQSILFEGASRQVGFENQANAAEYRGQVQAYQIGQQKAGAYQGIINSFGNIAQGLL